MIAESEIRSIAGRLGIAPPVVNHDYALGVCLHALAQDPTVAAEWLFKGGTCLSKCHFAEYRFSEDLDFTTTESLSTKGLTEIVTGAAEVLERLTGIRTSERPPLVETINDDYGRESFEARIYFRGPWNFGSSPRALRIHVSRDELIVFDPVESPIAHPYSDRADLPEVKVNTYALEEVCVEKLRAYSGQRKHAIARDIFDLNQLSKRALNFAGVVESFPLKCRVKGVDSANVEIKTIQARVEEYRANWNRNVEHLIPSSMRVSFADSWDAAINLLSKALHL